MEECKSLMKIGKIRYSYRVSGRRRVSSYIHKCYSSKNDKDGYYYYEFYESESENPSLSPLGKGRSVLIFIRHTEFISASSISF